MELSKVTMILRGYTYEQVRCVAEVLINSSYVKNMEITLNTSNAYEIIKRLLMSFKGDCILALEPFRHMMSWFRRLQQGQSLFYLREK